MKKTITFLLLLALVSCAKKEVTNPADTIYFGGDIVTMEGEEAQYAEAVAVKEGKILFVGTKTEAEKFHGEKTEMKDLGGKTMVPGFIDGHCHFFAFGSQAICANLLAAPDGNVNNIVVFIS
ncbi:hypothetical protein [Flavobacterium alvei]|uniref:hypothetical protein n=1 Tax=Flavobacterium alvei TaxID=2080416 RepID=UPI0026F14BF7|nr:hypothetical protein [Flavobacterium alvei]